MSTSPPDGPTSGGGPDYGSSIPGNYGTNGGYPGPPPSSPPPGGPYRSGSGGPNDPSGAWSAGDALAYGWRKFQENLGQILLAALVVLAGTIVALVCFGLIRSLMLHSASCSLQGGEMVCTKASGLVTVQLASALGQFIITIVTMVISAAFIRGALDMADGKPFRLSGLVGRINVPQVVLAGLLVSIITAIGTLLCVIPGVVAWFFLLFTPFFVVDKNMGAVDAIKASVAFTRDNLSNMLVWVIIGGLVYLAGFCLCGVGALVSVPVVLIGAAFTFRKLSGESVAS